MGIETLNATCLGFNLKDELGLLVVREKRDGEEFVSMRTKKPEYIHQCQPQRREQSGNHVLVSLFQFFIPQPSDAIVTAPCRCSPLCMLLTSCAFSSYLPCNFYISCKKYFSLRSCAQLLDQFICTFPQQCEISYFLSKL